jgi:hypothetical protein
VSYILWRARYFPFGDKYITSYPCSTPVRGDDIESFPIFSGELLGASISAGIEKVTVIKLSSLVHFSPFTTTHNQAIAFIAFRCDRGSCFSARLSDSKN